MQNQLVRLIDGKYLFYMCPGCKRVHHVELGKWLWNGSVTQPTISPSVRHSTLKKDTEVTTCHYFIENGMIRFLSDSIHDLAGKTVSLPTIPNDER